MAVARTFRNPVVAGADGEDHGDPFVIKYLDSFYLYHTGETSGRRGISVHRSQDLVNWESRGYALEAAASGWSSSDLWAPEVVYERGVFYMYVAANDEAAGGAPGAPWASEHEAGRRVGVARSASPLGPFVWDERPLVDTWSIDAHPFRDDDGSMWLFYNVRSEDFDAGGLPGTGTVCDRLLAPDRVEGRPAPVTFPSHPWEGVQTADWFWNEAPYVLKRRGTYFQLYSGGCFADSTYAVGIAAAPSPRGPWRKDADNPILSGGERIVGPGHYSFVYGPDVTTPHAVYHAYADGGEGRKVHLDRLFWAGDKPWIEGPTEGEQPVPPGAVFDPGVPHWRAEAWARGSWVQVEGRRFPLQPAGVWHQVEAVQADGRLSVRVGGVLCASYPVRATRAAPFIASDGALAARTVSSALEDGAVHELPAWSSYVWQWGGGGAIELALAVKGTIRLELDEVGWELEGERDRYRLVRAEHLGEVQEIAVHARGEGATVTDLAAYARG